MIIIKNKISSIITVSEDYNELHYLNPDFE